MLKIKVLKIIVSSKNHYEFGNLEENNIFEDTLYHKLRVQKPHPLSKESLFSNHSLKFLVKFENHDFRNYFIYTHIVPKSRFWKIIMKSCISSNKLVII